ncbi:MAG: hypothetical protein ACI9CA_002094 [Natronomonas sp.]|jgi:hypothetical protein
MFRKLGHTVATNYFLGFSVLSLGLVVFALAHGLLLYSVSHLLMGALSYAHHVVHMSSPLDDIEDRYVADSLR